MTVNGAEVRRLPNTSNIIYHRVDGEGIVIGRRLTQNELAGMIGTTRESVNKHLSDWTRQGILMLRDGRMVISDIERVRSIARVSDD